MADAKKCDRCGKCYDPWHLDKKYSGMAMTRFRNPVFQTEEDFQKHAVSRYLVPGKSDTYVDLCPDCSEDFELFMEGYELAVQNIFGNEEDSSHKPPEEDCDLLKKMKAIAKDLWGENGPWKTSL